MNCCHRRPTPPEEDNAFYGVLVGSIVLTVVFLALTLWILIGYRGQPDYGHVWFVPALMMIPTSGVGVGAIMRRLGWL